MKLPRAPLGDKGGLAHGLERRRRLCAELVLNEKVSALGGTRPAHSLMAAAPLDQNIGKNGRQAPNHPGGVRPQNRSTEIAAGMFVNPKYTIRRLLFRIRTRSARSVSGGSAGTFSATRVGCCPRCKEFVSLGPPDRFGEAPCPACGKGIRSLEPLGMGDNFGLE